MMSLASSLARGQIVFFAWVTLTEHKWVIFAERRGANGLRCPPKPNCEYGNKFPEFTIHPLSVNSEIGRSISEFTNRRHLNADSLLQIRAPERNPLMVVLVLVVRPKRQKSTSFRRGIG